MTSVPNVPSCPTVPNGTGEKTTLKGLAEKVLQQNEERLGRYRCSGPFAAVQVSQMGHWISGTNGTLGTEPTIYIRNYLMNLMTDWNERAAIMTQGDLSAEQAELAAWHDLGLDRVFFTRQQLH